MCGYQAAGAAPFVAGKMIDEPETVATAIRIGHPQSWDLAWIAQKESGGWFDKFSDEQILAAQKMLSQYEGIFCETRFSDFTGRCIARYCHRKNS